LKMPSDGHASISKVLSCGLHNPCPESRRPA
jgi:hypothetical protein